MTRLNEWMLAFAGLGMLWYECRQDLAVFCYRIGCNVLIRVHRQAMQLRLRPMQRQANSRGPRPSVRFHSSFPPFSLRP